MTDVIRNINSNNQVSSTTSRSTTQTSNDESTTSGTSSTAVSSNERVEITGTAQQLDDIVASLASEPAVDRQKVEDVKLALAEGRFEVNSSVVAERLLEIDDLLN